MSDKAEDYYGTDEFIERWYPEIELDFLPELTQENMRFNIAKKRAAEYELRKLKSAIRTVMSAGDTAWSGTKGGYRG